MASLNKERNSVFRIHWKFRIRVGPRAGEIVEGSLQLGRCTKTAAKAELRKIDEWEERVKTGRHVPDQSWREVFRVWLGERKLSCTEQTVQRAVRVFRLYTNWRKQCELSCACVENLADRSDLIAWRDHRLNHEAGRKTVANDLSTLSAFFQWCVDERFLMDNPVQRITRPRFVVKKEGTPLTRTQAGRWIKSIKPRTSRSGAGPWTWEEVRRKRAIIVFLLNTGLRNGELCATDIEDLRLDDESPLVHIVGKGLKARWVPLNRAALAAIGIHLKSRGCATRGPLFVTKTGERYNVQQLASEVTQTARCTDLDIQINPHNLRHTFATWLVKAVFDVSVAQKILGHENVNTTLKYYVHTGDHELAGATACLKPRWRDTGERKTTGQERWVIPFPKRQVC